MSFEKLFVLKKLNQLQDYIDELKDLLDKNSNKAILSNSGKMHIAERLLQLISDIMVDINQHFIKELNLKMVEDFQSTFYTLGDNNILQKKFAIKIAPVVGIRNRLVHRYEELDKKIFVEKLRDNYKDFYKYIKLINKYIKK
ncbi:hypothetical protein A2Y83_04470 [Candidatus Falkowbacteria bacterium RBG_13_39_14]|uniref:DUF86 domain-containing protein n=1 Tax=Candidatus Falkowbacteria bacterium RBG_13_39_14 TaxID=1797985 RepID=A0A1F5S513_9BACT|nr:MAG: hypothetical protein A2Y83_04470 [Candidatus Falkowbacteria bacterium RBG_13_39_14]